MCCEILVQVEMFCISLVRDYLTENDRQHMMKTEGKATELLLGSSGIVILANCIKCCF